MMNLMIAACLPILGGIALSLMKPKAKKAYQLTAFLTVLLTSVFVLLLILQGAPVTECMRLSAQFSIAFGVDGASRVLLAVIAALWPLATLYTFEYMRHEEREKTFLAYYVMTYGVMVLLASAANLFTLYCMYEMLTFVTLPLVWHKKDKDSILAARAYVKYSIGCAAFLFAAMIIIGSADGEALFTLHGGALRGMSSTLVQIVFLFGFFGFGVKATVFPLSAWLPKACAAPTPVTALLHAVAVVNAGVFAVMRLIYFVFDPAQLAGGFGQAIAVTASVLTILWGGIMAVKERHVKRKLAYSTVSNLGYMLTGLTMMSAGGMTAGMMHMITHSVMKIALFFCIGAVMCKTERAMMPEIRGLARRMPVTFCIFAFSAIALMGIPPLCGFASKAMLLTETIAEGTWLGIMGAIALLISAVLTAIYALSTVIPAFVMPYTGEESGKCDPSWRMLIPLGILVAAMIVIGINPKPFAAALMAVAGM